MKGDLQIKSGQRDRTILLLIALLALGLILRLYRLNDGLWLDEILTLVSYARAPFVKIISSFDSENQHFLYSLAAHWSFIIFGESAWALRLPAVLFGVASIYALFLFGSEVASKREALLATALMTFSYYHVWFSQNGRGYTSLLLWTLLSSWFLLRAIRTDKRTTWIFFALAAAAGIYTHLTMAFVIVGQALVYLVVGWGQARHDRPAFWRGWIFGFVVLGLLAAILYAPVFNQVRGVIGGSEVSVVQEWKSPLWTLAELIRGSRIGFSSGVVAIMAFIWFGIGLISYWNTRIELPLLLFIPAVVGAGVTLAIGHHLWPRFFFFTYGFAALIVVRGAFVIAAWTARVIPVFRTRSELLGTLISLGIILASALSIPFAYGPKQDYHGALDLVQQNLAAGDQVALIGPVSIPYQQYYQTGWQSITNLNELQHIQENARRTWVIYGFPTVVDSLYPELMAEIKQNYRVVQVFPGSVESGQIIVAVKEAP